MRAVRCALLSVSLFTTLLFVAGTGSVQAGEKLNEEGLGKVLGEIGLKPKKEEQRYDFEFKAKMNKEDWNLSMSAVLSQDESSIWLIAWLDELPRSAADVPRSALLNLLAANDQLGSGKFFAYIPNNRRFVMQRVVANDDMDAAKFQKLLKDLGATVVQSYPLWAVSGWKDAAPAATAENSKSSKGSSAKSPTRSAANDSNFDTSTRR